MSLKPQRGSDKDSLRAAALAHRQALTDDVRAEAARAIAGRRIPLAMTPGSVVAGYMPIRGEVDPRPLMATLAGSGASLALPSIAANEQPLIFRIWRDGDVLRRGALGILEPLADAEVIAPDIVLVPLAAFDRRGHRIGYGAGHYDRALGRLRLEKRVLAIGLAFALQEIAGVPNEAHDVPLDLVLTERESIAVGSA